MKKNRIMIETKDERKKTNESVNTDDTIINCENPS